MSPLRHLIRIDFRIFYKVFKLGQKNLFQGTLDWIKLIKINENKALKLLYKHHRDDITRWLKSHYKLDDDITIDIFQQSVIILYDNVVTGKANDLTCEVKSYMFGICKNKAKEYVRDSKRHQNTKTQLGLFSHNYKDDEIVEKKELEKYIGIMNEFMETIGFPCKKIFELFYYKKLDMTQICDILGYKNVNTTKNQKYKCIKMLQSMVSEHIQVTSKL